MANPTAVETSPPQPASAPAKAGLVPILMTVLMANLVTLAMFAGGGWWLVKSGKLASASPASATQVHPNTTAKEAAPAPPSQMTALEPVVINLSDAGGRSFLRASISLRIASGPKQKGAKEESGKEGKADAGTAAALRDTTVAVLSRQTSDALLATGGLDDLKKRLREAYAADNADTRVLDVYVTDFLVQRG